MQKINISFNYIVKFFLISIFYGIITPAQIGAYISVFYVKKKADISYEKSITNSLLDSSTELISGIFLALIGSFFLFDRYPGILSAILFIFLTTIILFIVLLRKKRGKFLFELFIKRFIPDKLKELVSKSVERFYEDIPKLRNLILPILFEIVVFLIMGLQVYIIAIGFSINIPIIEFTLIYMISFIVGILPISVGGLGVREGAFVFILSIFSVDPNISFVVSILGFSLTNLIPGFLGWIYSIKLKNIL